MCQQTLPDRLRNKLRRINPQYSDQAYVMVLASLEYCQSKRLVRGHISGEELAWGVRDLAREQYGLLARTVLLHWGISATEDIGEIVFGLIDAGLLVQDKDDCKENFRAVYDFKGAFDRDYAWPGLAHLDIGGFEPRAQLPHT